jgi:hypothetical protein
MTAQRKGFALPMAVLAMALVTAAVIAAYSATSAESVSNNALRAQYRAHQLATAGLQQFLVRRGEVGFCSNCVTEPALADSEWTRVTLPGGYADVVASRVRPKQADGTPAMFFVRSRGVDTAVRLSGAGGSIYATRTVGQFATFGTPSVKPLSAWTSLNGITNVGTGSNVKMYGVDACFAGLKPGLTIPFGAGGYRGSGTPPFPGADSSMSMDTLKKRVGIDWEAIINQNAIPADITIPPDGNWPSFNDPSYWPIIRIRKSFTVPTDGRGLIIADSNLTMSTNDVWDGIVLVGGRLKITGSGELQGVVVTGLNRLLPGNTGVLGTDSILNTKRVQYSSCKAASAADRLRVYFALPNTWVDNVADW